MKRKLRIVRIRYFGKYKLLKRVHILMLYSVLLKRIQKTQPFYQYIDVHAYEKMINMAQTALFYHIINNKKTT